jgi:predicted dehydrogenase
MASTCTFNSDQAGASTRVLARQLGIAKNWTGSALGQRVIIVGIGMAGAVHVKALEDLPGVALVAGVDTDPRALTFRGVQKPIYPSLFDATSQRCITPDIVVVATPTSTHTKICGEIAEYYQDASILVEKPAADNLGDARRIVCGIGGKQPVTVAYHMAFSPVVEWGLREVTAREDQIGTPVSVEAWCADPYQAELACARERLGNSWIDSGINALSVIERFVRPVERTSLRPIGSLSQSIFEGTFACDAGGKLIPASIMTSWYSTAPSRWTKIVYSSGAELVMDHNAVAGYIRQNGEAAAVFGSDGFTPRREAHYKALYRSWLVNQEDIFSADTSMRLHELLLAD